MSDVPSDIDELPEDVRSLLEAEKSEPAAPPEARAMVLDRVFSTVGLAPAPLPTQPPPVGPVTAGASATSALSPMMGLVAIGATLVVAAGAIALRSSRGANSVAPASSPASSPAALSAARATSPVSNLAANAVPLTVGSTQRSPIVDRPSDPAAIAPARRAIVAPPSAASVASARRHEEPDEPHDALVEEQQLLGAAQRALTLRDADAALTAVRAHARRFARGSLAEERDALEIRALLLAEREDEARALAARFRRRYPDSVFIATIDARLGSP
ncbi:MAG: hypothetical protein U0269_22845 [Polyangiales bacterium]